MLWLSVILLRKRERESCLLNLIVLWLSVILLRERERERESCLLILIVLWLSVFLLRERERDIYTGFFPDCVVVVCYPVEEEKERAACLF